MTEGLVAESFVRSAYRLPAPLIGGIAHTAKTQYNSVREVMEVKHVYSHFAMSQDDHLLCIFGPQRGILLGETMRDWIAEIRGDPLNFLWCEQLGSEFAIVCVLDGQVAKETFEDNFSVLPQLQLLVKRLQDHSSDFSIFLHNVEQDGLGLGEGLPLVMLEDSVMDRVERANPRVLPQLHPFSKALSKVTRTQVLLKIIFGGILAAATIIPGAWYGAQWWYGDAPEAVMDDFTEIRKQNKVYMQMLRRHDVGKLLPAIYRESKEIMAALEAGSAWRISGILWNYGGNLQVTASIPEVTDVSDKTMPVPSNMKELLQKQADARGWTVQFFGLSAKIEAPVASEPRTAIEADALRLYEPTLKTERWHVQKLAEDMEVAGNMEISEDAVDRTSQYYFRSAILSISDDPWFNGETAAWLGRMLSGGPLLLDSVILNTSPKSQGGLMDGTIKFRLLWRAN